MTSIYGHNPLTGRNEYHDGYACGWNCSVHSAERGRILGEHAVQAAENFTEAVFHSPRRVASNAAQLAGGVVMPLAMAGQGYWFWSAGFGWWSLAAILTGTITGALVVMLFDVAVALLALVAGVVVVGGGLLWFFNPDAVNAIARSVQTEYTSWKKARTTQEVREAHPKRSRTGQGTAADADTAGTKKSIPARP